MFVPHTNVGVASSMSSPASEDDSGTSSVDDGDVACLLPLDLRFERDGVVVGVSEGVAKRDWLAGGVRKAVGVVDRRRRRPPPRPRPAGEEKVLSIGVEIESSGDDGPKNQKKKSKFYEYTKLTINKKN